MNRLRDEKRETQPVFWLSVTLGLAAILLVALPRLVHLGGYLIIDEADRWRWAEAFYRALISGDLRATMVGDGYPGIVPVWVETLWLLGESLRRSLLAGHWFGDQGVNMLFHVWNRTEYLTQQRLPIAIFNSILALSTAFFAGKVFGKRIGLVALVFIALNPFYLSDSRVNRAEAVVTGLLTLSILFMLRYDQIRRRVWLLASGVLAGLSILTKIQGLAAVPALLFILLLSDWTKQPNPAERKCSLLSSLLVWTAAVALTWIVLWPAMWVRPLDVIRLLWEYVTMKTGSEGVNLFFAGQHYYHTSPGALFYPVVAVLRMTPTAMIGLALVALAGVRRLIEGTPLRYEGKSRMIVPLLIYAVAYAAVMTAGSHKQDRYLMPVFLVLDVLAALGWVFLWDIISHRWQAARKQYWGWTALAGLLLVQTAIVLPYHPYYFPYFNQLLGGGQVGVRTLRVGWGEGMDRVADYLNSKPNAAQMTVATRWAHYMLNFKGDTLPFDELGQWTEADYVVLYVQQVQRMLDPSPGVIRYFQMREAEEVITINSIDYAYIYPSPLTRAARSQANQIPGRAALLGYYWQPAGDMPLQGLDGLRVVWENLSSVGESTKLVAALAQDVETPIWQGCWPAVGFESAALTHGELVESVCDLDAGAQAAGGAYDLRVGVADEEGEVTEFMFPLGQQSLIKEAGGHWRLAEELESFDLLVKRDVPASAERVERNMIRQGQVIRLAAYQTEPVDPQPGQSFNLTLYWQPLTRIDEDYLLFNHLFGLDGTELASSDGAPDRPTSQWLPGQVISSSHHLPISFDVPAPSVANLESGLYYLDGDQRKALSVFTRQDEPLPATLTRVRILPEDWPDAPPPLLDGVQFGQSIQLVGHQVVLGNPLQIDLWWQTSVGLDTDYAVFLHMLDDSGRIVGQGDGVPVQGRYPTTAWRPGEVIVDKRSIQLPSRSMPGRYRLIVGVYELSEGNRLPVSTMSTDFYQLDSLYLD